MSSLSAKRRFFEEAEGEGEEGEGGTEGAGDQQQHQRRPHQYSSSALKRAKLDLGVSTKPAEEVLISQQQPLATIGFGSCLVSPVLLHVPQTTPFGLSTGNTPSTSSTNTPITFIPTSSSSVLNSTQNKVFHIQKMLPTLDKPQLLAILNHLLTPPQASNTTSSTTTSNANTQHHQQLHLEITQTLASAIPPPTLANIHSLLQSLSLNFQQAFPYSRNGVDYSDYTFNRVKPALTELLDAVVKKKTPLPTIYCIDGKDM